MASPPVTGAHQASKPGLAVSLRVGTELVSMAILRSLSAVSGLYYTMSWSYLTLLSVRISLVSLYRLQTKPRIPKSKLSARHNH